MEFSLPISPFLLSSYNNDTIMVDAAAAKDPMDINCNSIDKSFVNFYKMYLPERDFDADTYYMGIINMLTFDKIQDNGEYVSEMYNMNFLLNRIDVYYLLEYTFHVYHINIISGTFKLILSF